MLVIGGVSNTKGQVKGGELFDEASGRWYLLPYSMVTDHKSRFVSAKIVSAPAAVLEPPLGSH
jgi:hypothetical protein